MVEDIVTKLQAALAQPVVLGPGAGHRLIAPAGWTDITKPPAQIAPFVVGTLTGLVDYLEANRDELELKDMSVLVRSWDDVVVVGKLEEEETLFRRAFMLHATLKLVGVAPINYGNFMDAESFFIALQSACVPTEERENILRLIATIRESVVHEVASGGPGQTVTRSASVAIMETAPVPNPVRLKPYRTFREIDQPESSFVFRLRSAQEGKPLCALFEADGGAWKLEAMQRIRAYLTTAFTDKSIAVPVLA